MKLSRNYAREGTRAKGDNFQWWSQSFRLFGLHVFTRDGERWHWKINAITTWDSSETYASKEVAMFAALSFINKALREDIKEMQEQTS